ncbi:AlpA family phage regulatory protein [Pectobacterium versatile]|uniref:AlpA family phage regulatory protein n=1 Tax=Pectobacterium brasiliense TaxID=180957 RepID=A0AAE2WFZ7_9GAMM|nr:MULTISPECIES: AlpA family phage regulatory protein [Pectobacterium]MBN3051731.1 AlpA family phage regulatory protein [Pectobacterium brasiliense]MBQ4780760.1 AlpA family phage regulatory protein [Pectobacterium versatile]MBQ4785237.1 AlpA family phage regulatory protein [Pectobacterium versatile]TAJ06147.1 AlpA family phage regulatory protein [Pectobacterium versatile]
MAVTRILRIQEVLHRCALSRASLYRLISDGSFPTQRRLSPYGRSVGWLEEDIEGWISSRKPAKAVMPEEEQ